MSRAGGYRFGTNPADLLLPARGQKCMRPLKLRANQVCENGSRIGLCHNRVNVASRSYLLFELNCNVI